MLIHKTQLRPNFVMKVFTTVKADHRVLQHIYKEHFLIRNFLRLGFQIINLQPWPTQTKKITYELWLTPAKIPFGVISQSRWHCNALAGQIVPGAQLGRAIAEIRPMYWDLRSFLRTCHISGEAHLLFSWKKMHLSYLFYQPFNWFNVDLDWKLCLGVVV